MMWLRACQICSQAWACQLSHRQQSLPTAPAHGHHQQFHQAFTGQDDRKPLSLQVSDSQRKKENCVGGLDSNLQPESHSSCRRNKGHEKGRSITLMRRLGTQKEKKKSRIRTKYSHPHECYSGHESSRGDSSGTCLLSGKKNIHNMVVAMGLFARIVKTQPKRESAALYWAMTVELPWPSSVTTVWVLIAVTKQTP